MTFENTSAFKTVILQRFEQDGWTATLAPPNTIGYDLELGRNDECVAVQVKHQRASPLPTNLTCSITRSLAWIASESFGTSA
jgi:hypothetical protein